MKCLVVSDTHGRALALKEVIARESPLDLVIHLGDLGSDLAGTGYQGNSLAVRGNADRDLKAPLERLMDLEGHRVLMLHGHRYEVKWGLDRLYYRGLEKGADIVLFGHTHQAFLYRGDEVILFNPGSLSLPRDQARGSYGLLVFQGEKVLPKIFRI